MKRDLAFSLHALYDTLSHLQRHRATLWGALCVACVLVYYLPKLKATADSFVSLSAALTPPSQSVAPSPPPLSSPALPDEGSVPSKTETQLKSFVDLLESNAPVCSTCCQCAMDSMQMLATTPSDTYSHLALNDSKSILMLKNDASSRFKVAKRLRRMGLDIIIEECTHSVDGKPRALYVPSAPFRFPFEYVSQKWQSWQPKEK